ncbi:hypothetical protein U1Q18_016436 [Sarracenia purpurea var. burkii]
MVVVRCVAIKIMFYDFGVLLQEHAFEVKLPSEFGSRVLGVRNKEMCDEEVLNLGVRDDCGMVWGIL